MSEAENMLLDKYNWDAKHPDYSTASFRKDEVLAAMKEIASLAFDAGKKEGDYFPTFGEPPLSKEQFISKLFGE